MALQIFCHFFNTCVRAVRKIEIIYMGELKSIKANNKIQCLPLWGTSSTGLVPGASFNFREKDENHESGSGCDLDLVSA